MYTKKLKSIFLQFKSTWNVTTCKVYDYGKKLAVRVKAKTGSSARILSDHTYNLVSLYEFHKISNNKPDDIYFSKHYDSVFIYGNDLDQMLSIIKDIKIDNSDVLSVNSPKAGTIDAILSGKEYSTFANEFKYKIFFKKFFEPNLPLLSYLEEVSKQGECRLTFRCKRSMAGGLATWENSSSFIYTRDDSIITMIMLLAGDRYSRCVELVLPE